MCQWLDRDAFQAIVQPQSRAENARQMLCDLRAKGVLIWLDGARKGYKIRSSGAEILTDADRAGMAICRQALREALLREQERCIRCCGKNRMAWPQDLCHDCIMELGMPLYEKLTRDKRLTEGSIGDQLPGSRGVK